MQKIAAAVLLAVSSWFPHQTHQPVTYDFVRYIPDDPMRGVSALTQAWADCREAQKDPTVKNCLIQDEGSHHWLFQYTYIEGKGTHNLYWQGTTTGNGTLWECAWKDAFYCENENQYPMFIHASTSINVESNTKN